MEFQNQQVHEQDLPQFSNVSYIPLAQRFALLRLGVVIFVYFLMLITAAGIAIVAYIVEPASLSILASGYAVMISLLVSLIMIFLAWFVFASTRAIHYAIRDHDIISKSGLFWVKEVIQPLKRVQHVEVTRGPLDKRFGLANVKLFSAGTSLSTFRIPGIEEALAEQIRQYVLDYQEASKQESTSPD